MGRCSARGHQASFSEPDLREKLHARRADTLVITGCETDVCVLAIVMDAVNAGYRVVLASDGPVQRIRSDA